MPGPNRLVLDDLIAKYEEVASSLPFERLYHDDVETGHLFSVLHKRLNEHFEAINGRALTTRHYWAENSRDFIALIKEVDEVLYGLKRAGVDVNLDPRYQDAIERCRTWLSPSGGSAVPEEYQPLQVAKDTPVFSRDDDSVKLVSRTESVPLKMVGEGSYGIVYSYVDPEYGAKFAVKRAKRDISSRDLQRFRREFEVMERLNFPYVVEVFRYDERLNEYRMEFCDETLRTFVSTRNNVLTLSTRKRVALQFLYGVNYIHSKGLLHRDIGLQNVLVKVYEGAVLVKLSDFGLVKEDGSEFTRASTELRGTILDPQLEKMQDYSVTNEVYAIGCVLHFIFTGRAALRQGSGPVSDIVLKCTDRALDQRYESVLAIIADVEALATTPTDAPA